MFAQIKTLDLILVVLGSMKVPEQEAGFEDISNEGTVKSLNEIIGCEQWENETRRQKRY